MLGSLDARKPQISAEEVYPRVAGRDSQRFVGGDEMVSESNVLELESEGDTVVPPV